MSTYYKHVRMSVVDNSSNVTVLYPESTASDITVSRTNNSNIPSGVTNIQLLSDKLKASAFKNIDSTPTTNSTNTVSSGGVKNAIGEVSSEIQTLSNLVEGATEITTKSFSPVIAVNDALPVNAVDVSAKIEPIQAGSGTPSPTNIRAISGRSEVTVSRMGKNLLTMTVAGIKAKNTSGTWNGNDYTINGVKFTILVDSDNNVTGINVQATSAVESVTRLYFDALDLPIGNYIITSGRTVSSNHISVAGNQVYGNPVSITVSSPLVNGSTAITIAQGYVGTMSFYPMIRLSTVTDSTFEPYVEGNDYTIQLGDTYYGGTLDVTTGVFTVNMGIIDLGDLTYAYDSQYSRFESDYVSNMKLTATRSIKMACSCYEVISDGRALSGVPNNSIYNAGNNSAVFIHDSRYTNGADLKTALTGQKLVYPISTPSAIIQLTPQEIQMLQGNNTIFTDSGDTSIQYYANGVKNLETVVAKMQTEADGAMNNQLENGAVNLLENKATSATSSGFTMIVNADKSVTANGSGSIYFLLKTYTQDEFNAKFAGKRLKISGTPKNLLSSEIRVYAEIVSGGIRLIDEFWSPIYTMPTVSSTVRFCIKINGTVTNAVFRPMVTVADMLNSDYSHYVPYVKSNKELTDALSNRYVTEFKSVTVTTDGVKTYETLLRELQITFINEITSNAYTANDRFVYNGLNIEAVRNYSPNEYVFCSNTYHPATSYSSVFIDGTNTDIDYVLPAGSNVVKYYRNQNGTVIDRKSLVPPSGRTMIMYFTVYRKIS